LKRLNLCLIVGVALSVAGCSSGDTSVSKDQEDAFKNPPKQMPADIAAKMQQARANGMKKAEEMRKANPPTGTTGGATGQ
jgi:hypothetical protein